MPNKLGISRPSTAGSMRAFDTYNTSRTSLPALGDTVGSSRPGALPAWPLDPTGGASPDHNRAALWPPSPFALQQRQRSDTAASLLSASMGGQRPASAASIVGRLDPQARALAPGGPLHSGAGSMLQQTFEYHGPVAHPPFNRGFPPAKAMLPSAQVVRARAIIGTPPPPVPVHAPLTHPRVSARAQVAQAEQDALAAEAQRIADEAAESVRSAKKSGRPNKEEQARIDAEASAKEAKKAAEKARAAKERNKPLRKVFVHVRDKTFPVAVGAGQQCVYWLAQCAVQRYMQDSHSYVKPFSNELTALKVLARVSKERAVRLKASSLASGAVSPDDDDEPAMSIGRSRPGTAATSRSGFTSTFGRGEMSVPSSPMPGGGAPSTPGGPGGVEGDEEAYFAFLKNDDRLAETGLVEGDHVWIDIGDGNRPSGVLSRTFAGQPDGLDVNERPGAPLLGFERSKRLDGPHADAIIGEEVLLSASDRQPDRHPTVQYYQVRRAPPILSLEAWCERQQRRRDGEPPVAPPSSPGGASASAPAAPEPWEDHEMNYDDFHACFEQVHHLPHISPPTPFHVLHVLR